MTRRELAAALVAGLAFCPSWSRARADAPYLDGDITQVDSANKEYVGIPSRDNQSTTVFRKVKVGKPQRLWTVGRWDTTSWLSNDGDYLVLGYHGVNLLQLDHKPDEVMLTFFHRDALVGVVRLNDIILDRSHLQRTVSHYDWGNFVGFVEPHQFAITTIENRRLVFDVTTGKRVSVTAMPEEPTSLDATRSSRPKGR